MTLEQFCKRAGCEVFDCGPGWGGRFGIRDKGSQSSVCGYRTKDAAYRGYVRHHCGQLANQVLSLIRASEKKEPA